MTFFLLIYVQGACIAINADKWLECLSKICAFHNLPPPTDDERLPVGTGSNPVSFLFLFFIYLITFTHSIFETIAMHRSFEGFSES